MQQKLLRPLFLLILLAAAATGFTQQKERNPKTPRWATDKGFWVVESTVQHPEQCTVRFYNVDKVLVYSEQLNGVRLRLEKKRVLRQLKAVLEQSVLAWQQRGMADANKMLLAVALHR